MDIEEMGIAAAAVWWSRCDANAEFMATDPHHDRSGMIGHEPQHQWPNYHLRRAIGTSNGERLPDTVSVLILTCRQERCWLSPHSTRSSEVTAAVFRTLVE
jgi:hypothetical protein